MRACVHLRGSIGSLSGSARSVRPMRAAPPHLFPRRRLATAAPKTLPQQARVVIVGGGIIGSSIAYHLAHAGWRDIVLLERDRLTSGTTWHAAGLMVTFGSTSGTSTALRKYSKDLYSRLEAETGQATGFEPIGFIELATTEGYLEEFRRVADYNRLQGIDVQEIGPADVAQLFPLCRVDDVLRGFYVADDGRVNPVDATMALCQGARRQGAQIIEGVTVADVLHRNGRVCGVRTADGQDIACEFVVNCAGMWARELAARSGVSVPLQVCFQYCRNVALRTDICMYGYNVCVCVCMYVFLHVCMCVCMYTSTYTYIHVCMCSDATYIHVCMCSGVVFAAEHYYLITDPIHTHIHTCKNTYIHTRRSRRPNTTTSSRTRYPRCARTGPSWRTPPPTPICGAKALG